MDVRLCPKCRAKNWPDKTVCAICNESLEGVPLTQQPSSAPASAAQAPAGSHVATPAQTQQMAAPAAPIGIAPPPANVTQQDATGLPPIPGGFRPAYQPPVVSSGMSKWPLVVMGLLLAGGIAAAVYFGMPKKEPLPTTPPEPTVQAFVEAKKSHEIENVKPYLSEASLEFLKKAFDSPQARSAGFDEKEVHRMYVFDAPPAGKALDIGKITIQNISTQEDKDAGQAVVLVKAELAESSFMDSSESREFVLVPEGGKWKIDLPATQKRESGGGFSIPGGLK